MNGTINVVDKSDTPYIATGRQHIFNLVRI